MFYILSLGSHTLFGPFTSRDRASEYAKKNGITSYRLMSDKVAQQNLYLSIITVKEEDR